MANISVLMFDETYRGYYIHGKSATGSADLSSENLSLSLEHEMRGKASMRGLTASRPDAQTFQINMPNKMVTAYEEHYLRPLNQLVAAGAINGPATGDFASAISTLLSLGPALPDGIWDQITAARESGTGITLDFTKNLMNKIMRKYIEQVRNDPKRCIRKRKWIDQLLGLHERSPDVPIMFEDTYFPSFANIFLFGLDFDFLMMEVLVIAAMEKVSRVDTFDRNIFSPVTLGVLVAYLIDSFMIWLRKWQGSKNLSRNTVTDEKFLIS